MPENIFISYRRDDSLYQTERLAVELKRLLPEVEIFYDRNSIASGADFDVRIKDSVDSCDVMLVVIGDKWLNAPDSKTGSRRIDNPKDIVRLEVSTGLKRGIRVIPIMLDGAQLPTPEELPKNIRKLVRRNCEVIEFRTFDFDIQRIVVGLGLYASTPSGSQRDDRDGLDYAGRTHPEGPNWEAATNWEKLSLIWHDITTRLELYILREIPDENAREPFDRISRRNYTNLIAGLSENEQYMSFELGQYLAFIDQTYMKWRPRNTSIPDDEVETMLEIWKATEEKLPARDV